MTRSGSVARFAQLAGNVTDASDLRQLMGEIARRLHFDFFSISHHVPDPAAPNIITMSTLPESLVAAAIDRGYWTNSLIAAASRNSVVPFTWSDLSQRLSRSQRGKADAFLATARQHGLAEGFTVPANLPAGVSGYVSFALQRGNSLPTQALPAAQFLACHCYEAMLRISSRARSPAEARPILSTRQLDCVVLVARGKSDWEAGRALGISKDTVHKHIQAAMQKLGVNTRTQLVVRALYDVQISFSDVFKPQGLLP